MEERLCPAAADCLEEHLRPQEAAVDCLEEHLRLLHRLPIFYDGLAAESDVNDGRLLYELDICVNSLKYIIEH